MTCGISDTLQDGKPTTRLPSLPSTTLQHKHSTPISHDADNTCSDFVDFSDSATYVDKSEVALVSNRHEYSKGIKIKIDKTSNQCKVDSEVDFDSICHEDSKEINNCLDSAFDELYSNLVDSETGSVDDSGMVLDCSNTTDDFKTASGSVFESVHILDVVDASSNATKDFQTISVPESETIMDHCSNTLYKLQTSVSEIVESLDKVASETLKDSVDATRTTLVNCPQSVDICDPSSCSDTIDNLQPPSASLLGNVDLDCEVRSFPSDDCPTLVDSSVTDSSSAVELDHVNKSNGCADIPSLIDDVNYLNPEESAGSSLLPPDNDCVVSEQCIEKLPAIRCDDQEIVNESVSASTESSANETDCNTCTTESSIIQTETLESLITMETPSISDGLSVSNNFEKSANFLVANKEIPWIQPSNLLDVSSNEELANAAKSAGFRTKSKSTSDFQDHLSSSRQQHLAKLKKMGYMTVWTNFDNKSNDNV